MASTNTPAATSLTRVPVASAPSRAFAWHADRSTAAAPPSVGHSSGQTWLLGSNAFK